MHNNYINRIVLNAEISTKNKANLVCLHLKKAKNKIRTFLGFVT